MRRGLFLGYSLENLLFLLEEDFCPFFWFSSSGVSLPVEVLCENKDYATSHCRVEY